MSEAEFSVRPKLFRAEALAHLQSPEQVDQLMRVVDRPAWIFLLSLAFVLACAVFWCFAGRVPTYVEGKGILSPAFGERRTVVATDAGVLRQMRVDVGDSVKKGQVLARVEIRDAIESEKDARNSLRALEAERIRQQGFWDTFIAQTLKDYASQATNLETQVGWAEAQVDARQKIVQALNDLGAKGLTTPVQIDVAQDNLITASRNLSEARIQLQQLKAKELELEHQKITALYALDDRILDMKSHLNDASARAHAGGIITADIDGTVVERDAQIDNWVQAGSPLLAIQPVRNDVEGVFFAEPNHGKNVRVGMEANVAPSTAEPERYGTIRAKVVWVSPEPQTDVAVARQLGNATLARKLSADGPVIAFGVVMQRDAGTPSGLAWTSGQGPPDPVQTGTLAKAEVAVKEEAPAVLIIPALRRLAGIGR